MEALGISLWFDFHLSPLVVGFGLSILIFSSVILTRLFQFTFLKFFVVTNITVKVAINRPGMDDNKLHPYQGVLSLRLSYNTLFNLISSYISYHQN